MGRKPNNVEAMKARNISVTASGCWEWTGKIASNGYGHTTIKGKCLLAHRAFYSHAKGEIPEGLTIDHLCRNKRCVNPDHLEAVTSRENTLRASNAPAAMNHVKTHCKRGHELSGANLYLRQRGCRTERWCRKCNAERQAQYNSRKRV